MLFIVNVKNMYTTKESVEYCVWNTVWLDVDNIRCTMRAHVADHVDDELLQRILNNVPRDILQSIGGAVPLGIELKATLNQELRKYEY
jgi:hypothetical protein